MIPSSLLRRIPPYAADISENFVDIFKGDTFSDLDGAQVYAICFAAALALKNEMMVNNFKYEGRIYLEMTDFDEIKSAVVVMARNNYFHRLTSAVSNDTIKNAHIDLKQSALSNSAMDKTTLKMCMLAVSIIHNCADCMKFYADNLLAKGISETAILGVGRIVAILKAVTDVIEIEAMRSYDFAPRGENI